MNKNTYASLTNVEQQRCFDSLDYLYSKGGHEDAQQLVRSMQRRLDDLSGESKSTRVNTPYINTIPPHEEPDYPGDLEIENKIKSWVQWNAMAMVVKANRVHDGLGGHISTFASSAVLYEVGFNHFFRGNNGEFEADQIFFQGHASPGIYSRAYLEHRFESKKLHNFRQELAQGGGLSSYPHPYLMPDFWQFPTVSMGLGPILAIYQARFNKYLHARGIIKHIPKTWCFVGDGEVDEPETLGALSLAAREKLDQLIFVVNCNLQRLDGPVRGNGQIVQELESVFLGSGWNPIKVLWGSNWDPLIYSKTQANLLSRFDDVVDGQFQKFSVESGAYVRKHFFGKDPELLELVNSMTDSDIKALKRGGHDPKKVYAAYKKASEHKGQPTVILAKTVKGYGLGEAGEGKNISHQQKKMNEKELRLFRNRLNVPIDDEAIVDTPFFRPSESSIEYNYMIERRKLLNGFLPERKERIAKIQVPTPSGQHFKGSGDRELSTTMAFVRYLTELLRTPDIGKRIVPIIPDEARTFGMEALFRQYGIYAPSGQLYEPVDSASLLYYREEKDGQILEEGINEAGAMSSFISAGTSYATHGQVMIPFYIYYSMFGFQRIGDLAWLAADMRTRGFLCGGTSGRTTLNGEGLQHQDGHSLILASTIPSIQAYDTAFGYEIVEIINDGIKRMYQDNEAIYYYLTLGNENYTMPEMPKGAKEGILKGMYEFKTIKGKKHVNILASGSLVNEAIKAQEQLVDHGIGSTIWCVTNYKRLREESIQADRTNLLNPTKKPEVSYLQKIMATFSSPTVAVSDNMRIISDQISPWVPHGLLSLGTDGFGRSDTRENLRQFFEVDEAMIVLACITQLKKYDNLTNSTFSKIYKSLNISPKKNHPFRMM
ncbi:MAG: pyruvate dehydrogenase (acetyl-transferring), homodimeric type [Candidatus Margulisbacteria bacterium]|nr:pyruvate dehydrogenase (acetyl-transferring), homodimeric type [Candidatus Margulisiibacteriota bacterium]